MDKDGNSLETLPPGMVLDRPYTWAEHLDKCAMVLREVSKMTALPNNVKRINYVANDLELLASRMRHPSNG